MSVWIIEQRLRGVAECPWQVRQPYHLYVDSIRAEARAAADSAKTVRIEYRATEYLSAEDFMLRVGPVEIDRLKRTVKVDGGLDALTPLSFALLEELLLAGEAGRTCSELADRLWHHSKNPIAALRQQVMELRRDLRPFGDWVQNIRGVGYKFQKLAREEALSDESTA